MWQNIQLKLMDFIQSWIPRCWSRGGITAGTLLHCFYHQTAHSPWSLPALKTASAIYLWLDLKLPRLSISDLGVNSIYRAAPLKIALTRPSQNAWQWQNTHCVSCTDERNGTIQHYAWVVIAWQNLYFYWAFLNANMKTHPLFCWMSMWNARCICWVGGIRGDGGLHMFHICLHSHYRTLHLVWLHCCLSGSHAVTPTPPPLFFFISIVTGTAATGESRSTGN